MHSVEIPLCRALLSSICGLAWGAGVAEALTIRFLRQLQYFARSVLQPAIKRKATLKPHKSHLQLLPAGLQQFCK